MSSTCQPASCGKTRQIYPKVTISNASAEPKLRRVRCRDMSKQQPDLKPVILVVDDDALLRFLAVDILEAAGFAVIEAENAEGALGLLQARPDITALFTDIEMPGSFNGLELARLCHRVRPEVRVVVTSGNVRPRETELAPGDAFVAKPYRDRDVIDRLRGQSRNRQAA